MSEDTTDGGDILDEAAIDRLNAPYPGRACSIAPAQWMAPGTRLNFEMSDWLRWAYVMRVALDDCGNVVVAWPWGRLFLLRVRADGEESWQKTVISDGELVAGFFDHGAIVTDKYGSVLYSGSSTSARVPADGGAYPGGTLLDWAAGFAGRANGQLFIGEPGLARTTDLSFQDMTVSSGFGGYFAWGECQGGAYRFEEYWQVRDDFELSQPGSFVEVTQVNTQSPDRNVAWRSEALNELRYFTDGNSNTVAVAWSGIRTDANGGCSIGVRFLEGGQEVHGDACLWLLGVALGETGIMYAVWADDFQGLHLSKTLRSDDRLETQPLSSVIAPDEISKPWLPKADVVERANGDLVLVLGGLGEDQSLVGVRVISQEFFE